MQNAATLPRIEERPAVPIMDGAAIRLKERLGYSHLLVEEKKCADEAILFDACVAANVRPFRTEAVAEYMRLTGRDRYAFPLKFALIAVGLLAVASIAGAILVTPKLIIGLGVAILGLVVTGVLAAEGLPDYRWRRYTLRTYDAPVPLGVLEAATAITDQYPDVGFDIHVLERQERVSDPFLSVQLGDAMFYVAVWGEPNFDAAYE